MTDQYFRNRDGLNMHFRDYAGGHDRPALLCLHGLTRNTRDFEDIAARYAPRFRVLALDFRGRALSEPDPEPSRYHPLTYAYDVIELLDHLAIDQAVFIGTSLGGLVTMLIGGIAPQRIAGAVLNDIGPEVTPVGIDRIRSYLGNDARFASWAEAAKQIAINNHHVPARYGDDDWLRMAHRVCREEDGTIRFDYDMAIAAPFNSDGPTPEVDMWPLYRAVAAAGPLLLFRGEHSDLLDAEAFARMAVEDGDIASVTVAGVGHAPDLNEPESLAALDAFLGRWDAARTA